MRLGRGEAAPESGVQFPVAIDDQHRAGGAFREGFAHHEDVGGVDPDGEGGPGYTIRCEINRRPYTRGVVGMALGGKDTGGSQFFVMLAAHPHLDGKYTSFGEVVRGQEIVDSLLEGDKILEIAPPPPPPED